MGNGERGVWMQWTEAANLLGIRQGQILRLIEERRLPAEETSGGIVMVRRADVERLREEWRERRPAMLGGN
jgi:excisionase family DNA binding protein